MAKVTYLHDLVKRQFEQIVEMDKEGSLFSMCGATRRQSKVSGRASKVLNKLVDLEWEAMLRPTTAPDTFSVGYGEDNQ